MRKSAAIWGRAIVPWFVAGEKGLAMSVLKFRRSVVPLMAGADGTGAGGDLAE
jgi:hypothetical protein